MFWFGSPWPSEELRAPICEDDTLRMQTPVGEECLWCHEEILEDDRGVLMTYLTDQEHRLVPVHIECNFRQVMGGPAHLRGGKCEHCGGEGDPDLGMTPREAAQMVWDFYEQKGSV